MDGWGGVINRKEEIAKQLLLSSSFPRAPIGGSYLDLGIINGRVYGTSLSNEEATCKR
jgi:hypothetical protein